MAPLLFEIPVTTNRAPKHLAGSSPSVSSPPDNPPSVSAPSDSLPLGSLSSASAPPSSLPLGSPSPDSLLPDSPLPDSLLPDSPSPDSAPLSSPLPDSPSPDSSIASDFSPTGPSGPRGDNSSNAQDTLIRKRKRKKRKRKGLRVAALILLILVVAGGLTVWMVLNAMQSGEKAIRGDISETPVESNENAVTYDEGKTVSYNGHTYALNENMVSIVFIGFDRFASAGSGEPAGQADAVMVIALDTQTGETTAIGVPRDSMVDVSEFVGDAFIGQDTMQLCLSYSYGDGRERSCENTVTAVSRILYNMPITYYFALNESGIAYLNDAIGGVSLTPLQTVPGTNIVEGENTVLFGNNAYRYVQWRDTAVLNSSIDRQARQIQYVKTFASQALQLSEGSVGVLLDLFNITADYSVTNLGVNEFSYLASTMLTNNVTNLDMVTLDGEMVQGDIYAEYYLDRSAVYETVLEVYYRQVD
jgi:anionic cell wall polymer biosynthesis LytR-Cps2A-Psr (LCP) family protein